MPTIFDQIEYDPETSSAIEKKPKNIFDVVADSKNEKHAESLLQQMRRRKKELEERRKEPLTPNLQNLETFEEEEKKNNTYAPGTKYELYKKLSPKELEILPLEKRQEFEDLGSQLSRAEAVAALGNWIPGVSQLEEKMKETGKLPQEPITPSGIRTGLEIAGQLPLFEAGLSALKTPQAALGSKLAPVLGKAAGAVSKISTVASAGAAYESLKKIGQGKGVPTPQEAATDAALYGGFEAAALAAPTVINKIKDLSKLVKKPPQEVAKSVAKTAVESGIDLSKAPTSEKEIQKLNTFIDDVKDVASTEKPPKPVTIEEKPKPLTLKKEPVKKLDKTEVSTIDSLRKKLGIDKSDLNEKTWSILKDRFGEKYSKEYESRLKWQKGFRDRFPDKKVREDMTFYRENPELIGEDPNMPGTGNPLVSRDDTYENLKSRLPQEAKDFVDKQINEHFSNVLKEYNASPYTKSINPREFLEQYYIPHFYKGNVKQAAEITSKRFSTANPLANKRSFLSYNRALREAGLVPRWTDISDIMMAYDSQMLRFKVNSEIAGSIKQLEKDVGKKLIVRSGNARYDTAKAEGWVPFEDAYLRRAVVGKDAAGKPIFSTSAAPALVHPDLAGPLQGVFVRRYKDAPISVIGKAGKSIGNAISTIDNFVKKVRLQFSPFHYKSLMESYHAARGTPGFIKDIFSPNKFASSIDAIMNDPAAMDEMLRAGLNVHSRLVDIGKEALEPSSTLITKMKMKGGAYKKLAEVGEKAGAPFKRFSDYLFGTFHPRLKVATYQHYKDSAIRNFEKVNKRLPTQEELTSINRQVARVVNNQFGGQRWELIEGLNDPKNRRMLGSVIAYPDWTISAIREVQDAFSKEPVTRKLARSYLSKYASQLITTAQLANLATTGLYNKKDGTIGYDWDKARLAVNNPDPTKRITDVQLPDIYITINGQKIPVGRDENGRHLYIHEGKKLFEQLEYLKDPVKEIYSKSRPGIQFAAEQLLGHGIALGETFPVEAGYKRGRLEPWEGTKFGSFENLKLRIKHAATLPVPFSFRTISEKGMAPFIASGFGAVPISKGASTHSMEYHLEKAIRANDTKKINRYRAVLKDEGYEEKTIRRLITTLTNEVKKEKTEKSKK